MSESYIEPIGKIFWSAQIIYPNNKHWSEVWNRTQYDFSARETFMSEREAFAQAWAAGQKRKTIEARVVKVTHYWSKTPPIREIRYYPEEINPKTWMRGGQSVPAFETYLRQQASHSTQ